MLLISILDLLFHQIKVMKFHKMSWNYVQEHNYIGYWYLNLARVFFCHPCPHLDDWFHDTNQIGSFVFSSSAYLLMLWCKNLLNFFLTENEHSLYLHLSYGILYQLTLNVRQTLIFFNWKLKLPLLNWLLNFLNLCGYILLYLTYQLCKLTRLF